MKINKNLSFFDKLRKGFEMYKHKFKNCQAYGGCGRKKNVRKNSGNLPCVCLEGYGIMTAGYRNFVSVSMDFD